MRGRVRNLFVRAYGRAPWAGSVAEPPRTTAPACERQRSSEHVEVVKWGWNRPQSSPWELSALGMILDLAGMRPRWRHNYGAMASGGVRVPCAAERERDRRAVTRFRQAARRKPVTGVSGKTRRSMSTGTVLADFAGLIHRSRSHNHPHSYPKSAPLVRWWRLFVYDTSFLHHLNQMELSLSVFRRPRKRASSRLLWLLWVCPGDSALSAIIGRIDHSGGHSPPETAFSASLSLFPSDFCNPSDERESSRMPLERSRLRRPKSGFYSQSE